MPETNNKRVMYQFRHKETNEGCVDFGEYSEWKTCTEAKYDEINGYIDKNYPYETQLLSVIQVETRISAQLLPTRPRLTLVYNIVNDSKWIGTGWEFFDSEQFADDRKSELSSMGHCCTLRPYHHKTDEKHLGAAHRTTGE